MYNVSAIFTIQTGENKSIENSANKNGLDFHTWFDLRTSAIIYKCNFSTPWLWMLTPVKCKTETQTTILWFIAHLFLDHHIWMAYVCVFDGILVWNWFNAFIGFFDFNKWIFGFLTWAKVSLYWHVTNEWIKCWNWKKEWTLSLSLTPANIGARIFR